MVYMSDLRDEKKLWQKGYKRIACFDEAGRGSLAGPVVAAVVIAKPGIKKIKGVKDSKKLTPQKREEIYKLIIKSHSLEWAVGVVSEKVIDKINIKNAAELAMVRALKKISTKGGEKKPDFLIIDGNHISAKGLKSFNYKLIVNGDDKVFSCSCASIIAKVTRDDLLKKADKLYPHYGFFRNKGYGTKFHKKNIKKYGICKIHRKSFKCK
jgi:ribonuclease HII